MSIREALGLHSSLILIICISLKFRPSNAYHLNLDCNSSGYTPLNKEKEEELSNCTFEGNGISGKQGIHQYYQVKSYASGGYLFLSWLFILFLLGGYLSLLSASFSCFFFSLLLFCLYSCIVYHFISN